MVCMAKSGQVSVAEILADCEARNNTFRDMMLAAATNDALTTEQRHNCERISKIIDQRPLIGRILERAALHAYLAAHPGVTVVDWKAIVEWLVANMPTILGLLLSLLSLFGL